MLISPFEKPPLLPPAEHPRLLLKAKDLPRIKENISRPENALAKEVLLELQSFSITGKGATPAFGSYHLREVLSLEALAFQALLSGERADAEKAIFSLFLLLQNFKITGGNMGARWSGHLIFTAAEIYDWCYAFLSAEQKESIISYCEKFAETYFEMGYPPKKQTPISGHGQEAQLLRDLLAFSIAVYDERPDIYEFCAGRIFGEYCRAIDSLYAGGAHNQGPTYGSYRFTSIMWSELILRSLGDKPVFTNLEKIGEWLQYMLRPDGEALRLGDDFNENKARYNRQFPFTVPFFFCYALTGRTDFYEKFKKGLCREYLLPTHFGMNYYDESSWGEGLISPVSMLIFDRFTPKKEAKSLPVCRYFGSPVGETVFKKEDSLILMKIGEYWGGNHDHLDTGCFQVFRGAPLLTDSGVYDSYGSKHRKQYLTRTSAHNCLTVEREDKNLFDEWPQGTKYEGGVRRPNRGKEVSCVEMQYSDEYRMAKILSHEESENGCTLEGDLSCAYSHSCTKVVRRMDYDHASHTLTVRDTVSSNEPQFKKTFHLHMQTEPEIKGNEITVRNKGFRAVCRVLLPENALITKVGGEEHRFEVDGENFPPKLPYVAEAGWGEVRICPPVPQKDDVFLVEIQTFGKEE